VTLAQVLLGEPLLLYRTQWKCDVFVFESHAGFVVAEAHIEAGGGGHGEAGGPRDHAGNVHPLKDPIV